MSAVNSLRKEKEKGNCFEIVETFGITGWLNKSDYKELRREKIIKIQRQHG